MQPLRTSVGSAAALAPAARFSLRGALLPLLLLAGGPAVAAPQDALLGQDMGPATEARRKLQLELAGDNVNDQTHPLGLKLKRSDPASRRGDYRGSHLAGRLDLDHVMLEAARWHRQVSDKADSYHIDSWQFGARLRLAGDTQASGQWALRWLAWGDQSDQMTRRMNTKVPVLGQSTRVNSVTLHGAGDRQQQIDLIFSQRDGVQRWAGFAGLGRSRVANRDITGTATIANCHYSLSFTTEVALARPGADCPERAPAIRAPNDVLPYSAIAETNYAARYGHLGLSHGWQGEILDTRLGLEWQRWRRERIDTLIASRPGGPPVSTNLGLVGEIGLRLTPGLRPFARLEYSRHLFVGEIPLTYNTLTAPRFSKSFSMMSLGARLDF